MAGKSTTELMEIFEQLRTYLAVEKRVTIFVSLRYIACSWSYNYRLPSTERLLGAALARVKQCRLILGAVSCDLISLSLTQ